MGGMACADDVKARAKATAINLIIILLLVRSQPLCSLLAHDLFRKPVPTFRDHAQRRTRSFWSALKSCTIRSSPEKTSDFPPGLYRHFPVSDFSGKCYRFSGFRVATFRVFHDRFMS
jgi:hypothetical protein